MEAAPEYPAPPATLQENGLLLAVDRGERIG
jgi:hypothetical protein